MNIFLSQPMLGKTDEEIKTTRSIAINRLKEKYGNDVNIINTFITEKAPDNVNTPVWYLAKSIEKLSSADIGYFMNGWENYRGCKIEYNICEKYSIKVVEE